MTGGPEDPADQSQSPLSEGRFVPVRPHAPDGPAEPVLAEPALPELAPAPDEDLVPDYGTPESQARAAAPEANAPRSSEPPAAAPQASEPRAAAPQVSAASAAALAAQSVAAELREQLAGVVERQNSGFAALQSRVTELKTELKTELSTELGTKLQEMGRLRAQDQSLVDRLHAENTRLRTGELASAMAPLISGLLRLHDQMSSLAGGDTNSVAGMLRTQLLQTLDTGAGLTAFHPEPGDKFDASRHVGAGRTMTTDPSQDGTVARSVKPGFSRGDGAIARVAEVEVYRFHV